VGGVVREGVLFPVHRGILARVRKVTGESVERSTVEQIFLTEGH
jgi:hypothetical protein